MGGPDMSDNPFDEPSEPDRTIIRPQPGGGRRRTAEPAAPPPRSPRDLPVDGPPLPEVGSSPLLIAGAPLILLLSRLRLVTGQPSPAALREQAMRELDRFGSASQRLDLSSGDGNDAHFALCASIDDVVQNTPWGEAGAWAKNSLVAMFHGNVEAGEGFFKVLEDKRKDPANHLQLLELMYICLSLGFQGRFRVLPRGASDLERLREELYDSLKLLRPPSEEALSPHWEGENAPYEPGRASLPTWVVGAGVLVILALLFIGLKMSLANGIDAAFQTASNAAPAMPVIQRPEVRRVVAPPPPPPLPPGPSAATEIRRFLEPEIRQGLVTVTESATITRVQMRSSGMFASGSATLTTAFHPLLQRIGDALNTEAGRVQVIGHSDNQPIRTGPFPSNYKLSVARAEAARAVIAGPMKQPDRLIAEGRADQAPIASNDTAEGREMNRRIEIVLQRQD